MQAPPLFDYPQPSRFALQRKRALMVAPYGPQTLSEDTMLQWLSQAAREAREASDPECLQVEIAAVLRKNQSTVARFEKGEAWPRDPDATIHAYASTLEIDSRVLWTRALELWIASEEPDAERAARGTEAVRQASRKAQQRKQGTPRAKRPKRGGG